MVTILPVGSADAPVLAMLHESVFGAQAWPQAALAASLAQENVCGWQLLVQDVPAGFALCQHIAGDGEFLTYAVHRRFQRQGYGRQLLEHVVAEARARHWRRLFLEAAEDNLPALRLYTGFGFQVSGKRVGYYPRPGGAVAAVLMHYDL